MDPLADIVALLAPSARGSKLVEAAGQWRVERPSMDEPFYCAVLEGQCQLQVNDLSPILLQAGDFVLVPAMRKMAQSHVGADPHMPQTAPVTLAEGHYRLGRGDGPPDLRLRVGHCQFNTRDAALLVPLLPQVVLVREQPRLAALVQWVGEESRAQRPARDLVLEHLLQILLIEALRSGSAPDAPGLVRGLADARIGPALRALHADAGMAWTVDKLAEQAALSRSAFFIRFERVVGMKPMAYVLTWRMALAKRWLSERTLSLDAIAERLGYSSASTFSVAFLRHEGMPPGSYRKGIIGT